MLLFFCLPSLFIFFSSSFFMWTITYPRLWVKNQKRIGWDTKMNNYFFEALDSNLSTDFVTLIGNIILLLSTTWIRCKIQIVYMRPFQAGILSMRYLPTDSCVHCTCSGLRDDFAWIPVRQYRRDIKRRRLPQKFAQKREKGIPKEGKLRVQIKILLPTCKMWERKIQQK